ncbi:MAG: class I SAM-dependent methyltransferase [Syntrophobacteraceae bacterium]
MADNGKWLGNQYTTTVIDPPSGLIEINGTQGFLQRGDMELLPHFVSRLPLGVKIAEIGSFLGLSALIMAKTLYAQGNYGAKIFCIDNWQGSIEHQSIRAVKDGQLFDIFEKNVDESGLRTFIVPIKSDSAAAAQGFDDRSLDMIFIDGDHSFEGCYADLAAWYPKLKSGGIFLGHDCYNYVRNAVELFMKDKELCFTLFGVPPYCGYMYQIEDRDSILHFRK